MKYTLLEMTQTILSSMNADEVNSISDNAESMQVATLCKTVFYDLASELNLPEHYSVFELLPSGDTDRPTIMYRPDNAHNIQWLKYNAADTVNPQDNFRELLYVPIDGFFNYIHQYDTDESNIISYNLSVDGDSVTLFARNDIAPTYYSTFNDSTVVFDAYDASMDDTLQKTKTLAYGAKSEIFVMDDDFIPPFDEQVFALYYNECKALAWLELKESMHAKAEQAIKRQRRSVQKNKDAFAGVRSKFDRLPNYGRK